MSQITSEQANEIINHLISELQKNGFAYIAQETLENINEEEYFVNSPPRYRVESFLVEIISILKQLSNDNYPALIDKFNKYVNFENSKINSIRVEILDKEKSHFYNLEQLPNYSVLIEELNSIKNELNSFN